MTPHNIELINKLSNRIDELFSHIELELEPKHIHVLSVAKVVVLDNVSELNDHDVEIVPCVYTKDGFGIKINRDDCEQIIDKIRTDLINALNSEQYRVYCPEHWRTTVYRDCEHTYNSIPMAVFSMIRMNQFEIVVAKEKGPKRFTYGPVI